MIECRTVPLSRLNVSPHPEVPCDYWRRWVTPRGRGILVLKNAAPIAIIIGLMGELPFNPPDFDRIALTVAWNKQTSFEFDWDLWDVVPLSCRGSVCWWAIAPRFAEQILTHRN